MKTSNNGKKLIQEFEGCILTAYQDQGGVWTIGFGNTYYLDNSPVEKGDHISLEKAFDLFDLLLPKYEDTINNYCLAQNIELNQNQFDALVSARWNLGNVKHQLDSFKLGILTKEEWCAYCHIGIAFNQGLYNRRVKEWELFTTPVETIVAPLNPITNQPITVDTYTPAQIAMLENSPVKNDPFWKKVIAFLTKISI